MSFKSHSAYPPLTEFQKKVLLEQEQKKLEQNARNAAAKKKKLDNMTPEQKKKYLMDRRAWYQNKRDVKADAKEKAAYLDLANLLEPDINQNDGVPPTVEVQEVLATSNFEDQIDIPNDPNMTLDYLQYNPDGSVRTGGRKKRATKKRKGSRRKGTRKGRRTRKSHKHSF
jgi:hypothetical protein